MKSKFLSLNRAIVSIGLSLALVSVTSNNSRAANGTWTNPGSGSWTNSANWSGGIIASNSGFTADFSTLNLTSDATVTLDGARTLGSMVFGDTTPSHNWTLNAGSGGTLTLAGGIPTITVNNQTNTIGVVLGGAAGMVKAGGGTLVLAGANTYNGGTTINAGMLQIGNGIAGNVLASSPITNNSQLTIVNGSSAALTTTVPITGPGSLTLSGTFNAQTGDIRINTNHAYNGAFTGPIYLNRARLYDNNVTGAAAQGRFGSNSTIYVPNGCGILTSGNVYSNAVFLAGIGWGENTAPNYLGALRFQAAATWAGPITLTANARISSHGQVGNVIGTISGPYELELSGTSATTTLTLGSPSNGTIATRISNFGTTLYVSVTNANALSTGPLTMNGGILRLNGLSLSFSNLSSANALSQIMNFDNSNPCTLTVGADNSSTTFAGGFTDGGSAVLELTKVGSGTLTLSGTSLHNGSTVVSNGMLLLQGSSAAFNGSGVITVNSGATFGDSGSVFGAINVLAGGAMQASGLSPGTLTCSSPLTFGTSATDNTTTRIDAGLNGKIAANGGLTINGTNTINIVGASPSVGIHDLITYTGTIGGTGAAGFVLGTMPAGTVATLQDSGTAIQLNVTVSDTEPKIWKGNVAGTWSPAAGNEWFGTVSSTAKPYVEFDNVTFDDSASSFTVNLTASVTPSAVAFNNPTQNYIVTGAGNIGGSIAPTKTGAGTVTINTINSFTAVPALNEGTWAVASVADGGVNSPLGSASQIDFNGGTLQVNAVTGNMNRNLNLVGNATIKTDNTLTLSGLISGSGQWIKTGTGTLILTGLGTPGGGTLISSGTLQIGDGSFFLGGLAGNVENHGTLTIFRNDSQAELNLPGNLTGDGVVNFLGSGVILQARYTALGDNSGFTGTVLVDKARVTATTQARLSSASLITVTNGGGLLLNAAAPPALPTEFNNPLRLSGIGWLEGSPANYGAVRMINAILSGPITLAGNTRLTAVSSAVFGSLITGAITESGGSWKLEFGQKEANPNTSNGTIWLVNSNSYSGGTDIRAVIIAVTNGCLGPGPITLDEAFLATYITRLDLFGGITLTNAISLDSTAQTITRGQIHATNGFAEVSGPITITATPGNGGHFGADDASISTLRVSGPISCPTGISPIAFVGTVEIGGGGTYTNFIHGGGLLRLTAHNGISPGSALNLGTTTASTFDLNNFNQTVAGLIKGASASTITNSGAVTRRLTYLTGTSTYAGSLRGNFETLFGGGTCTLTGGSDYTGDTGVSNATLYVNGGLTNTFRVTVFSGGKLGGTGYIGGPTTIQPPGTLAPGTSIGTLTISNTLTLTTGSTTIMEISRNTGTPAADLVAGISTLSYGGSLIVTNIGTNTLRSGDVYNLFDATSFNPVPGFSSITLPPLLPGLFWNTNLNVDGTVSVGGTPIPPQFSPVSLSGSTLTFNGTGGLAGARYVVLTSTNVALPVINWNPIATNMFGGGGTFTFNDTVSSTAVPGRFYTIAIP